MINVVGNITGTGNLNIGGNISASSAVTASGFKGDGTLL